MYTMKLYPYKTILLFRHILIMYNHTKTYKLSLYLYLIYTYTKTYFILLNSSIYSRKYTGLLIISTFFFISVANIFPEKQFGV